MWRWAAIAGMAVLTACPSWERDVTRGGHAFARYRFNRASETHSGLLARDTAVGAFRCRGGAWAHFGADWSLRACELAMDHEMAHMTLPAGTWAMPRAGHIVVAFAEDTPCQGYICGGTGGSKGTHATFYDDGRLRSFFPPSDVTVGDVICRASRFHEVALYPDGGLRACAVDRAVVIGERAYRAGDVVRLDPAGQPQ